MQQTGNTGGIEAGARKRSRRWIWIPAGVALIALLGIAFVLQSGWTREVIRKRIVAALEKSTGGRVELRELAVIPTRLQVNLRGLTIHGREGAGEAPLLSTDLIEIGWKVRSVWGLRADLAFLRVWRPQVSFTLTDQGESPRIAPQAPTSADSGRTWYETALALGVGRLEVLRGNVQLKTPAGFRSFPLDFKAENVNVALVQAPQAGRYSGTLDFQKGLLLPSNSGKSALPVSPSGRARFSLDSQKAEIEFLELRTASSHVSAQGTLEDFRSPRLQFHYDLVADAREATQFFGLHGWQGEISSKGQGNYSDKGWEIAGPVQARAMKMELPALAVAGWSGRSELKLTGKPAPAGAAKPQTWQAKLDQIDVSALGGRITGTATIESAEGRPSTIIELQTDRISLPVVSGALQVLPAALARLPWAAAVSGPVQASFQGEGEELALSTDWRIEAAPVIPPGFTAVSGVLRTQYHAANKKLEIEGSYLNVGQSSISAEGWLDDRDSRISARIETAQPEDLRPLVETVSAWPTVLPISLHGRAKMALVWTGGVASPKFNGNVDVSDFDYKDLRWNSLSGGFDFHQLPAGAPDIGKQTRNAELKIESGRVVRGGATMEFGGTVTLRDGRPIPASPLALQAAIRRFNLSDLEQVSGVRLPVRGTIEGSFRTSGTWRDPRGQGNFSLTGGEAYGESFERLSTQLSLGAGGRLEAKGLRLQKGKGTIQGDVSFELVSGQTQFSLSGSDLALESFQYLNSHLHATGVVQAKLTGSGDLSRPAMEGTVEINRLDFGGHENGRLNLGIDARDGRAKVQWKGSFFGGEVGGAGDLSLSGQYPYTARLDFQNLDLVPLLRVSHEPPASVSGKLGGAVTLEGSLKNPHALRVSGSLDSLVATAASSAGQLDFRNAEPVSFRYENNLLQLDRLHLTASDTDILASGTVTTGKDPALNLAVKGNVNLAALSGLDPELSSSGKVTLDASLRGTLAKPSWRGRLDLSDATVRHASLPNGLSNLRGAVIFDGNRASLENVTGESGGGSVKVGGLVTYEQESGLGMQLDMDLSGVRVRYPEGVSTWIDGRLRLAGSPRATSLVGKLVITKQSASPDFDIGSALVGRAEQPFGRVKSATLRNLRMDVTITSAPNVTLETMTAKGVRGEVDLRIQGSLDHPSWLGRIGILQGEITIGGRKYLADHGELSFSNPFRIEPVLNLQVRARVEQYDIGLTFTGPIDRLTVTYNSDPPLPTSEILALLVAGNTYATGLQPSPSGGVPQLGAGSLLSQALNQQMGSRLDRIFGSGHIRIDMQNAGFDRPANANVAFEQHIKDNLTLLYVTNVTSAQQRIIQAELTLNPRFSVTALRDQNGLVGINFQIKLRFR